MKWFKHYTTARNDERIAALEDKAGLEGYGFYFKVLEIIAGEMNDTDKTEVEYYDQRWARMLGISTRKFNSLAEVCSQVGLFFLQTVSNRVKINIPNLLKYRDNYTKNLQVTNKQDKDKEEDKDKEKYNKKKVAPKKQIIKREPTDMICPKDFTPDETRIKLALDLGFDEIDLEYHTGEFIEYWTEGKGRGKKRPGWQLTFGNWIKKASPMPLALRRTRERERDEQQEREWKLELAEADRAHEERYASDPDYRAEFDAKMAKLHPERKLVMP